MNFRLIQPNCLLKFIFVVYDSKIAYLPCIKKKNSIIFCHNFARLRHKKNHVLILRFFLSLKIIFFWPFRSVGPFFTQFHYPINFLNTPSHTLPWIQKSYYLQSISVSVPNFGNYEYMLPTSSSFAFPSRINV